MVLASHLLASVVLLRKLDDLGALPVIAIFYTASIDWRGVALIAALLLALWVANRMGARRASIYLLLGLGLWPQRSDSPSC